MEIKDIKARAIVYLKTFLWRIYLPILLGGGLGYMLYRFEAEILPVYSTATTFLPSPDQGGAGMGAGSPLSMFLPSLGGSSGGSDMFILLRSRMLGEKVMMDSVEFEGKKQLLADIVLNNRPKLVGFARVKDNFFKSLFPPQKKENATPPTLQSKVASAANYVINGKVIETKLGEDEQTGLIVMKARHQNSEIMRLLSYTYIQEITKHYQIQRTEKTRKNYNFYVARTDSIKRELDRSMNRGAKYEDETKFRIFAQDEVPVKKEEGNANMLQGMYTQLVALREAALNDLLKETPVVNVLDKPEPPYDASSGAPTIRLIMGLLLGTMLGTVLALSNLIIQDLWKYILSAIEEGSKKDKSDDSEDDTE